MLDNLDYNATTPHDPEVIAVMRPYLEEHFGNPSSSHWYGEQTKRAVEAAREQVASLLNGLPSHCLPNTLSLSFHGIDATMLISSISDQVAVSAGSACHSGECKISPVLQAMNVPVEWARGRSGSRPAG